MEIVAGYPPRREAPSFVVRSMVRLGAVSVLRAVLRRVAGWLCSLGAPRLPSAHQEQLEAVCGDLTELGREFRSEAERMLAASAETARQRTLRREDALHAVDLFETIRRIAEASKRSSRESCTTIVEAFGFFERSADIAAARTQMIVRLTESVEHSNVSFSSVEASVDEVDRFLLVIQQIGNQTELLALNAAIEAARAGVHGEGFNVVAREMRLLADKTSGATEQIRRITGTIRRSTNAASVAIGAACLSSAPSREQGEAVAKVLEASIRTMRSAEEKAVLVSSAAEKQIEAIEVLYKHWRMVRDKVSGGDSDADTYTEMSARTMKLVTRLSDDLRKLGGMMKTETSGNGASLA